MVIARGTTLAALHANGLTAKSRAEGTSTLPVSATDDLATTGPVDLVPCCVKPDADGAPAPP